MNDNTTRALTGRVLDDDVCLTLAELSHACAIHAEWVVELVDQGILDPRGRDLPQWRFTGIQLRRALVVQRLQRDLDVNLAGAALALDLLDQLDALRAELARR